MVSEKPPRRSNRDKQPLTIDLTPAEIAREDAKPAPDQSPDKQPAMTAGEAPRDTDVLAKPIRSDDSDRAEDSVEAELSAGDDAAPKDPIKPVTTTAEATAGKTEAEKPTLAPGLNAKPQPAPSDKPATKPSPFGASSSATRPIHDDPPPARKAADADRPARPAAAQDQASANASARAAPATSTLVAAGIAGGIIALLLAGAMQYAGYLPSGGNGRADTGSALTGEIAALRQEVQALTSRAGSASGDLEARIAALESRSADSGANSDLAQKLGAVEGQLNDVRSAVAANEAKINDRGPEQQVARAVSAAALKSAIDRGGSFDAELQTYEKLAGGDQSIAALKAFATRGVPARADLQKQFPAVADAMLEAVSAPDPNQSLASRLFSSATSVVKVRRVGDVEGDAPDAMVARMENRLVNGDLKGAASEWNSLPEPARTVSADFKKKLDARIEVEDLVGGTLARALAGNQR